MTTMTTMTDARYVTGHTEIDTDGTLWRVVNVAPETLAWACSDGRFYPLGTGPELPPDARRPYGLSLADLVHPESSARDGA